MATLDREKTRFSQPMLVRDVMTPHPRQVSSSTSLTEAAQLMRDGDFGFVLVSDESGLIGVVTDRDIVVRAIAEGRDPRRTKLGDICSREIWALAPEEPINDAVQLMREHAIRRLPVVADGSQPIGIVSLGDLAQCLDRSSALGEISAARPNH